MKAVIACVFVLVALQSAHTQPYRVQGTVMAIQWPDTVPAAHAFLIFTDVDDPSLVYTSLTDTTGKYVLDLITSVNETGVDLPSTIELVQNYPNPFSSETVIGYKLHKQSTVSIRIYNILGQEVRSFSEGTRDAGIHGIRWDGRDNDGGRVAAGVYFYQLRAGNEMQVKKMLVGFGREEMASPGGIGFRPGELGGEPFGIVKANMSGPRVYQVEITNTDTTKPKILEDIFGFVFIDRDTTLDFIASTNASIDPPEFEIIDYYPAWSPDSTTIAYVHVGVDEPGLYLIDADGSNKRRILPVAPTNPRWSPDGEWIAYSHNAQIYKLRLSDGYTQQLTTVGRNFFPDWSPDGEWIAYDNTNCGNSLEPPPPNSCGILIMRNDGTKKGLIIEWARFPIWHPENQSLLGVIGVSPYDIWKKFVIYYPFNTITPDTLNAIIGSDNLFPRYSPDGQEIAVTSQAPSQWPKIWIINSGDSNPRQLTDARAYTCDWSPDGEWIVYTDTSPGNGRLWVIRKDGTDKRQFTFE
jgi:TolB protein